jgi:hypothetical protein
MTTRFVAFGCWNENCCEPETAVYKVLNSIKEEQGMHGPFNFSLVLGDNYYPKKDKDSGNKLAKIDQLSDSFQLLTTSLFGDEAREAAGAAAGAARAAAAGAEEEARVEAPTGTSALEKVPEREKEIFLLLGNHDVEQTIEVNNPNQGCYVTIFEKTFAQAFNSFPTPNKIFFPPLELVMFKQFGTHTLIIMIDTNIYSGENLDCYSNFLNSTNREELQRLQLDTISDRLQGARFQNIIVCGHNPLIGFKNQLVKTDKTTGKSKPKGGLDICNSQLYELMLSLKSHGQYFYYLCADIHNFQQGIVTISKSSETSETSEMQISQYIVGIGGTHLDDDYDEAFNPSFSIKNQEKLKTGINTAEVQVSDSLLLHYHVLRHFSDYGYLIGEINDNDLLFHVTTIIEQSRGGKRSKRKSKRNGKSTKRNNKRTKRNNKRTKRNNKHSKK